MRTWLLGRMHCSWQIAWLCLGIIGGTVLALHLSLDLRWLVICVTVLLPALIIIVKGLRWLAVVVLLLGGIIGVARASPLQQALQAYGPYLNQVQRLEGQLRDDVAFGKHGDQQLQLSEVRIAKQRLGGEVWLSATTPVETKRGDWVVAEGMLQEGFGTFAASMHRARLLRVQRPQPGDPGIRFRDWFAAGVHRAVAEPEAALGLGYLTGQHDALPPEFDEQLRTAGLTHAVVASGYNLTILIGLARTLLAGLSKYLAALSGAGLILAFLTVTGVSPSMARASWIAGLGLAAWYYGRVVHPVILLLFTAALTVLFKPAYAWGDLGWCLSFAAFAGVLILAPLLRHYFWGNETPPNWFWSLIVDTLSAQLLTLPLILLAFGTYGLYALPANLLVLPLIPLAMLLVAVAGFGALALPGLAVYLGFPAQTLLHYMIRVVEHIANLPNARLDISFSTVPTIICYFAILLLMLGLWRSTRHDFRA